KVIGDFGKVDTWHPGVVKEVMTGSGNRRGDTRVLTLQNGGTVTEVLVDHDDQKRKYTYTIKQSPLPVSDYLSTLKVLPLGKDLARVVWSATFNARGVSAKEAMDAVRGIYSSGFKGLAERFK
ncbi:MAG: SRPBCC family protein, partial [Gammaproteobacteria bacterium]